MGERMADLSTPLPLSPLHLYPLPSPTPFIHISIFKNINTYTKRCMVSTWQRASWWASVLSPPDSHFPPRPVAYVLRLGRTLAARGYLDKINQTWYITPPEIKKLYKKTMTACLNVQCTPVAHFTCDVGPGKPCHMLSNIPRNWSICILKFLYKLCNLITKW